MTKKQKKVLVRIIIASVLLALAAICPVERLLPEGFPWKLVLFLIPYFVIGYDVLRKAIKGILKRQVFDENFLMAVATVGALVLGEYAEGVAVMLFYQIGELFQTVAVGKSRRNIAALLDIRPDYANIEDENGQLNQVEPDSVEVGSVIVVCPGEKLPIDGIVVEGSSSLNTAALTGESLPRDVAVGDEVVSGCINLSGLLKIRTTKGFGESTVSRILELVENSGMKKSRSENFITKFARYYTPAVCYAALALACLPPIVSLLMSAPANWGEWVTRGLTFLVISCPCALVISIPLSFFGGIGGASACGILIKGSNYLETLSQTDTVVFDKTGTLTRGVFEVQEVKPAEGFTKEQLLRMAAHAEMYSGHPISKSLKEAFGEPLSQGVVSDVEEVSGHGIVASVEGARVAVGNAKLMEREGLSYQEVTGIGTVVHVAVNQTYAGSILIADTIKPSAREAIQVLKASGVKNLVMLTGDSKTVATHVAESLGIEHVKSELLPEQKVQAVEELLEEGKGSGKVAFVGDGINDAPVLSRADIGIAMGAMGSDAAIEAADIVLMDDNPIKIAKAMRISRKCLRIVYENIALALGVKGICLVLGAVGMANMWIAIFADVGVMVIAVLNAIRCLNVKKV